MTTAHKMITAFDAARLATVYSDVMRMVEDRSGFRVSVMTTPRKLLVEYLALCDKLGFPMHNEHWLKRAWEVVEEIEESRAAAARRIFNAWRAA